MTVPSDGWSGTYEAMSNPRPVAGSAALIGALVTAGRWGAALPALASALAEDPDDPALLAMLVRTLRELGRNDDAVRAARQLLAATPDDPYALRLAALVLIDSGWVSEAIDLASRAVQIEPLSAANHLALSRAWAASGRPEAVTRQLQSARAAMQLDPASTDAQVQIGTALAASADPAGARAAYQEALRLDPASSAALNNLAVLDLYAGAPRDAAQRLAAALATDPHSDVPLRNLDALAIRLLRRTGWWMVLAPIPAMLGAAVGQVVVMWLGVLAAVVGLPALIFSWLHALTPGQRRYLRGLTGRVSWTAWVWPVTAFMIGSSALIAVMVFRSRLDDQLVTGYLVIALYVALFRFIAVVLRPTWRAELAGRWERLRRR